MSLLFALLVLSFLVFVHELGHYLAAKSVGVKVEEFSVGFPPKVLSKKMGETSYVLGLIPLGGYVKLFGMNFEDENPNEPTNFAAKTVLQRLWVIVAGPLMNLLLAAALIPFVFVLGVPGPAYLDEEPVVYRVAANGPAEKAGIRPGDAFVSVNGTDVANWSELNANLARLSSEEAFELVVARDLKLVRMTFEGEELGSSGGLGISPYVPPYVSGMADSSPLMAAGVLENDLIVAINEEKILSFQDITRVVNRFEGGVLDIDLERNGERFSAEVQPYFDAGLERWLIGLRVPQRVVSHSFADAVAIGMDRLISLTGEIFSFLGRLFTGNVGSNEVGGPIAIFSMIGSASEEGLADLLFLVSFISFQLALLNLFPIPVLDGGHVILLIAEKIKGSALSRKFRLLYQKSGAALLFFLIIWVTYTDILRLF